MSTLDIMKYMSTGIFKSIKRGNNEESRDIIKVISEIYNELSNEISNSTNQEFQHAVHNKESNFYPDPTQRINGGINDPRFIMNSNLDKAGLLNDSISFYYDF